MAEKRKPGATQEKAVEQQSSNPPEQEVAHPVESQVADLLAILSEEARLTITRQGEGWTVEDEPGGRVIVRDAPLSDAFRSALRYLRIMAGGGR